MKQTLNPEALLKTAESLNNFLNALSSIPADTGCFGELSYERATKGVVLKEYIKAQVDVDGIPLRLVCLVGDIIEQMVVNYSRTIKTYGKKEADVREAGQAFAKTLITGAWGSKMTLIGVAHMFQLMATLTKPFDVPSDGFTQEGLFKALQIYSATIQKGYLQSPVAAPRPKQETQRTAQVTQPFTAKSDLQNPGMEYKKPQSKLKDIEEYCQLKNTTVEWLLEEWRSDYEENFKTVISWETYQKTKTQQILR